MKICDVGCRTRNTNKAGLRPIRKKNYLAKNFLCSRCQRGFSPRLPFFFFFEGKKNPCYIHRTVERIRHCVIKKKYCGGIVDFTIFTYLSNFIVYPDPVRRKDRETPHPQGPKVLSRMA
jgi:hypothetical protein